MEKRGANSSYWGHIGEGIKSVKLGLVISWRHFKIALQKKIHKPISVEKPEYIEQAEQGGIFTLEYPAEVMPVPANGRYRLHNEIEDCIVCDKCANVCPVNCIDIKAIKSSGEIRKASDGSSVRLYAGTFDIDMAKCCFCGLCTTVCPTECLTMTKTYDFSEFDITNMNYHFTDLTEEEAEQKQKEFDEYQAEKKAKMAADKAAKTTDTKKTTGGGVKPIIKKAGVKPVIKKAGVKPVIKPKDPTKE